MTKALRRQTGKATVAGWSCEILATGAAPSGRCRRKKNLIQWELNDYGRSSAVAPCGGPIPTSGGGAAEIRKVRSVSCRTARKVVRAFLTGNGSLRGF